MMFPIDLICGNCSGKNDEKRNEYKSNAGSFHVDLWNPVPVFCLDCHSGALCGAYGRHSSGRDERRLMGLSADSGVDSYGGYLLHVFFGAEGPEGTGSGDFKLY